LQTVHVVLQSSDVVKLTELYSHQKKPNVSNSTNNLSFMYLYIKNS